MMNEVEIRLAVYVTFEDVTKLLEAIKWAADDIKSLQDEADKEDVPNDEKDDYTKTLLRVLSMLKKVEGWRKKILSAVHDIGQGKEYHDDR